MIKVSHQKYIYCLFIKFVCIVLLVWLTYTLCLPCFVYALGTSVVDVTGLNSGTGDSHVCNNYSVSKYDANYHWKECNICGRILTAKQAHSYIKSGSDSCVWNNPGQVQSCSCGYSKRYKKDHVLKRNPDGSLVWIHSSDHNWDYNVCEVCGTGNINATRCVTTSGVLLGCGHTGKCKLCGTSFTGAYTEHGNNTSGYCSSWCQERYFAAVTANDYTCTRLGDNSFRITVTLHGTGNSRYTDAVFLSITPCISDAFTYSNFSVRKTADKTYVLQQDVTCTDPTTRNNNYLRLRWQFTKDFKHNSENLDICTNVDWTAPTITAANVVYTGSNSGFATKCNLNVSATDNLNNGYNICYVRVLSADRKTVIRDWTAMNKLSNVSYYSSLDYVDETSGSKNVIVQVRDAQTYKYNISEKVITVANLDSKPATITTPTSSAKVWSKTKSVSFTATDVGSGSVSISWQGAGNYVLMNRSGNTYSAPYTFTGEVYNFVKCTVNFRDSVSNVSSLTYDIYYLDNTAPSFTLNAADTAKSNGCAKVVVTADDYSSRVNSRGSGRTPDGAGKYGFYYGYSRTGDVNSATWSSLSTSTSYAYDFTDPGYYYFWVKDYAGNVSSRQQVFIDKFTLKLAADPVYGHGAASYLHYVFNPTHTFSFPASEIDTKRDSRTYTATFDIQGGAVTLTDYGPLSSTAKPLAGNKISTIRYFIGWHMPSGSNIGGSGTQVSVEPDASRNATVDTNEYVVRGNKAAAGSSISGKQIQLSPKWQNATLVLPDASRHGLNQRYDAAGNATGEGPDLFLGWFSEKQPADGASGPGGTFYGMPGDIIIIDHDVTLYPWFNIAPVMSESKLGKNIHDGSLGGGFFEGQRVTYEQLLSLVNAVDPDNPVQVGGKDLSWEGMPYFNSLATTSEFRQLYHISEMAYLKAISDEQGLNLSNEEIQHIVDYTNKAMGENGNKFWPNIVSITYYRDGTDPSSADYPVNGLTEVYEQPHDSVVNDGLLSGMSNVGKIRIRYEIDDNGAFASNVRIASDNKISDKAFTRDSSQWVRLDIVTDINYNNPPKLVLRSTYMYSGDEDLTADTVERFLWQKQKASDVEDESDMGPWWYSSESGSALQDNIRAVRVYDINFSSSYAIDHPDVCKEVALINNLSDLLALKTENYDAFSHITDFKVEWDCVDQWGKTASGYIMPGFDYEYDSGYDINNLLIWNQGDSRNSLPDFPDAFKMSLADRSMTVIMVNNKDDIGDDGESYVENMRYIDRSWLDYMDSDSYWGSSDYGKNKLAEIFDRYRVRGSDSVIRGNYGDNGFIQVEVHDYTE